MIGRRCVAVLALLVAGSSSLMAATYYVDFEGGADDKRHFLLQSLMYPIIDAMTVQSVARTDEFIS